MEPENNSLETQEVTLETPASDTSSGLSPEIKSEIERIIADVVKGEIKSVFTPLRKEVGKAVAPLAERLTTFEQQIQEFATRQQPPKETLDQDPEPKEDDAQRHLHESLKQKIAEQSKRLEQLELARQEEARRAKESRREASLFKARSEFNRTTDLLANTGLKLADGVTPDDVLAFLEKRNAVRLASDANGDPSHYEIQNEDEFGVADYVRLDPHTLSKALKPISFLVNSGRAGSGAGVPTNTAPATQSPSPYNPQVILESVGRMTEAELDRKLSTDEAFRMAYYNALS